MCSIYTDIGLSAYVVKWEKWRNSRNASIINLKLYTQVMISEAWVWVWLYFNIITLVTFNRSVASQREGSV